MGDRYERGRSSSRPRSPPPRRADSRDRGGSGSRGSKGGGKGSMPEKGHHKITIEGLPDDMTWKELKDLGRESGRTLTFARTYRTGNRYYGMLEYSDRNDAEAAVRDLDNRRVQDSKDRLRASMGDLAAEGTLGSYKGYGQYDGGGRGGGGRRDDSRDRRRSPPRRDRSPPRRRSRTPPRRSPPRRSRSRRGGGGGKGGGKGSDEEIMTLFVKDLPDDARESEIQDDIGQSVKVLRVMVMKKNDQCSAFVRLETVKDAEKALDDISDGKCKVCGKRVQAELARRNTDV